jgi:hypothetical protein
MDIGGTETAYFRALATYRLKKNMKNKSFYTKIWDCKFESHLAEKYQSMHFNVVCMQMPWIGLILHPRCPTISLTAGTHNLWSTVLYLFYQINFVPLSSH